MKKLNLFKGILATTMFAVILMTAQAQVQNTAINISYDAPNVIDKGTGYLASAASIPLITTVVGNDGSVSICGVDGSTQTAYIYEYTKDLKHIKTMPFKYKHKKFGAFTKDEEGNYYFFSAEDVEEGEFDRNNVALVKYNSKGEQKVAFYLPSRTPPDVKNPFSSSSCRLEISGDLVAVHFATKMFKGSDGINHQASAGFTVNRNSLEKILSRTPYTSHSLSQYIFPIRSGGFISVDQGDARPRSFVFAEQEGDMPKSSIGSFDFKGGQKSDVHYNYTFAQLGGLAKTPTGYIFCGAYEKNSIASEKHNDSRNLFLLTFDDKLTSYNVSEPTWITNYKNKETDNVANPKIAELDAGRYLLLWERMSKNGYEGTYSVVVDEKMKPVTSIEQVGKVRLNNNDVLRYSKVTKKVYWAVNSGKRTINIYTFKPAYGSSVKAAKPSSAAATKTSTTFVDTRDGKTYRKVTIGNQTWMSENLNYNAKGSECYKGNDGNCAKYGRLYNWETAMNGAEASSQIPSGVQGICPAGWHLPSKDEWLTLVNYVGGYQTAGKKLKSASGWDDYEGLLENSTDEYGFSALPGGRNFAGSLLGLGGGAYVGYYGAGYYGCWWSASQTYGSHGWYWGMGYNYDNVDWTDRDKKYLFSVRCMQN